MDLIRNRQSHHRSHGYAAIRSTTSGTNQAGASVVKRLVIKKLVIKTKRKLCSGACVTPFTGSVRMCLKKIWSE
jgi:hypothetical protein